MTAYFLALTVLAVYMVGVSLMTSQVSYPLYAAVPVVGGPGGDPGPLAGDGVHIAFDDDQPARRAGGGACEIEIVEGAALVEERGVGGVEIFGLAGAEDPPAEADHPAARVADRDHQPAAEAVEGLAALFRLDQHAGFDELLFAEVAELTVRLGGTMAGEHGDGRLRAPVLETVWGAETVACFRAVKDAFDPRGILNPGVVLPLPGQRPLDGVRYS